MSKTTKVATVLIYLPQPVSQKSYVISSCGRIPSTMIISLKQNESPAVKIKQIFASKPIWAKCLAVSSAQQTDNAATSCQHSDSTKKSLQSLGPVYPCNVKP